MSTPLSYYLVEAPLTAITSVSLLGYVSTNFVHLDWTIFVHLHAYIHTTHTGTILCAEHLCCLSSLLGYWAQSWTGRHSDTVHQHEIFKKNLRNLFFTWKLWVMMCKYRWKKTDYIIQFYSKL